MTLLSNIFELVLPVAHAEEVCIAAVSWADFCC